VAAAARALAAEKSAQSMHDAAARLLERAAGVWAARSDPADSADAAATVAGGVLRAGTQPTLNRRSESVRLYGH
jgi:hypothetical protein